MSRLIGSYIGTNTLTIALKSDTYNSGTYGGTSYGTSYGYNGVYYTPVNLGFTDSTFNNGNYTVYSSTSPTNITSINNTLGYNSELLYLAVGPGITYISNLTNCSNLQAIYIDGINYANTYNMGRGSNPFTICPNLQSITINPNSTIFSTIDGILYDKNVTTIICYPAGKLSTSYTAPTTVLTVQAASFVRCLNLQNVILDNVTTIENNSFQYDTNLTSITIPNVTNIGGAAFGDINKPIKVYTKTTNSYVMNYSQFPTNSTVGPETVAVQTVPCFKEDTKILTINGYVPIQNLRKGDLIKTLKNEYVPINIICHKTIIIKKSDSIINKLFVCTNENYPEIFEDLYITGLHSILVDNLSKPQIDNIMKLHNLNNEIYVTDDKYRLHVCYDERASLYGTEGEFKIYHLALDNDNEINNYGIYANGLLVETTSIKLLEESDMILVE